MQEKLFNRNYVLLCISHLCSGISFFMLLPVLPLYLTGTMGISKSLAGVIVSLYTIAALVVRPLSGPLVDRYQRKPFLVLFTALFAAACSGYIFVANLLLFALVRLMHGMFFSVSSTSINTVAIDNIPASRLGTGIGIFGVTVSLSMALAPMIGIGLFEMFSAQITFVGATLFASAAALLTILISSSKIEISKNPKPILNPKNLFLRAGLLPSLSYLLTIFAYGLISNFIALLAYERGLESSAGLFFLFLSAGLVSSRLFSGVLLDKGYLGQVIIAGQMLIITSLIYMLLGNGKFMFLSSGLVLGVGFGMCMPSFQGLIISLAPKNQRGTANSTFYTAMDTGIGLSVLSGGFIADMASLSTMYAFGAFLASCGLLLFLFKCVPLTRAKSEQEIKDQPKTAAQPN